MDVRKFNSVENAIERCPNNQVIIDNMIKAWTYINDDKYKKIVCSVSGGSDSDVMLDICWRCDVNNKIEYVWFDTGLEYNATKEHLKYLEEKYGIKIITCKAIKSIPSSCIQFGQPFINKRVSENMKRLQQHGFKWEDDDFEVLYLKYPKCKSALQWWCNENKINSLNIKGNKWLKEFIISNPPNFKISNQCCDYAKKKVIHKLIKDNKYDLSIFGVRKAEGGARAIAYKSCFDNNDSECDNYRPLFWYTDNDKRDYEMHFKITHSNCYCEYGLRRTGCAGCPFGRNFENELEIINEHEPRLFTAVNNIFGKAYEYTRRYREFCKEKNNTRQND